MAGVPISVSVERVRAVVADMLGVEVMRVERLSGSVANQDFGVHLAEGARVILKAGPATEVAAEAWACERLTAAGLPVPRLVALELDATRLSLPFLMVTFVEGEPSDGADVARDAGGWFRQVHAIELPGWGPLLVTQGSTGIEARGRYSSWRDAIEGQLTGLPDLVAAGLLTDALAGIIRALVDVEHLDYTGPGVLLHNDLKPAHLYGIAADVRWRLSATIDWGDASVGDPAAELARLSMSGPVAIAAFLDGYGAAHTRDLADRLARYRILWNVRALSYEYRAGGDWFGTYRARIAEDVNLLT